METAIHQGLISLLPKICPSTLELDILKILIRRAFIVVLHERALYCFLAAQIRIGTVPGRNNIFSALHSEFA